MLYFNYPKSIYNIYKKKINKQIIKVLESGNYSNNKELYNFENKFSQYIKTKFSVGVGNATDAIYLSLLSLGIKKNDEVITVSHTATGTATGIANTGAKIIFSDISINDYNIDLNLLQKKITRKTKAIVVVHLYGQSCDMNKLLNIVKKNKLFLIEDCSQAAGAFFKKKRLGSFGTLSCFSFFPTKNLSAYGDGGMICCNNKNTYNKLKALREYGWDKKRNAKYIGINSRLDELQASILNIKLNYLDKDNKQRIKIAKRYQKNINNRKILISPIINNNTHVYHLFVVRCKQQTKLINYLKKNGIFAGIHYKIPVHKQKIFLSKSKTELPVTEKIANQVVSLPIYPGLKKSEQDKVIKALNLF